MAILLDFKSHRTTDRFVAYLNKHQFFTPKPGHVRLSSFGFATWLYVNVILSYLVHWPNNSGYEDSLILTIYFYHANRWRLEIQISLFLIEINFSNSWGPCALQHVHGAWDLSQISTEELVFGAAVSWRTFLGFFWDPKILRPFFFFVKLGRWSMSISN